MVIAVNTEAATLSPKIAGPTNPERTTRIFNADLSVTDPTGTVRPYLAETLPQLNTDSWRLLPDGRMETVWRLRAGLTWHDGRALTAEDFVFAHRVYTTGGLGVFTPKPQDQMEQVAAPDPRTVVIRWRAPYLDEGQLEPLPRHILEGPFAAFEQDPGARDAFLGHRYWTTEYVGAGPFRLTSWEQGSHLEGTAFDGHALGRPKIDRVVVRFISDENTVLTNMLAESIHYTVLQALRFEHAVVLLREWAGNGKGVVLLEPTSTATAAIQHRAEYVGFPALIDLRVRRALAHSVDKEALNEALFEGQSGITQSYVPPEASFFTEVDRAVTKYPYDPRRTEQLMFEAGFRRDRDGLFASAGGERFQPTFWVTAGTQTERQLALMTDTWRRAGIDMQPYVVPAAQARDNQVRSTFPGLLNYGVSPSVASALETLTSGQIGTAANRWGGQNRGGWSSPEYDRLHEVFGAALDQSERNRQVVQMMKLMSEQLPNLILFSNLGAMTHLSVLQGPAAGVSEATSHWNIHEWELR